VRSGVAIEGSKPIRPMGDIVGAVSRRVTAWTSDVGPIDNAALGTVVSKRRSTPALIA
jgi:hypothetical protein